MRSFVFFEITILVLNFFMLGIPGNRTRDLSHARRVPQCARESYELLNTTWISWSYRWFHQRWLYIGNAKTDFFSQDRSCSIYFGLYLIFRHSDKTSKRNIIWGGFYYTSKSPQRLKSLSTLMKQPLKTLDFIIICILPTYLLGNYICFVVGTAFAEFP